MHHEQAVFNVLCVELTGLSASRLADAEGLSAVVVAAAGAIGVSTDAPPMVRRGHQGVAVGLLCRDGHVVLHTMPDAGHCLVDIVARAPLVASKGADVIARRLGASLG
jgi:S-adenosylmethionine/arginine decarboxylase-like enzyme